MPQLLLGCQTDLQNRLSLRNWYPVKLGSTGVSDAFKHPPNQPLRYIKFSNLTIPNRMVVSQTIKTSNER